MDVSPRLDRRLASLLRTRTTKKKRTIIVGLKSHNFSREMLLRLLALVAVSGDNVLAVHVQERNDLFDPNSFHIHEDFCKSKQVDFQIKFCTGDSFITVLTQQVRLHFAAILALGCSAPKPKDTLVGSCLKRLPPTCNLLFMDNGGRVLIQQAGTSQEGSMNKALECPSITSSSKSTPSADQLGKNQRSSKPLTMPSSSTSKPLTMPSSSTSLPLRHADTLRLHIKNTIKLPCTQNQLLRLECLEAKGAGKHFTSQELSSATENFSPKMMIGQGAHGKVYKADLGDGRLTAVKVLHITPSSGEELLREVEILSELKHENIVQLIGYCYSKETHAVVYNLLNSCLKHKLKELRWRERMTIAVGIAKALDYLHHSCFPPMIHRDVKSSNVLLSHQCEPQLSDFGAAIIYHQSQQARPSKKPIKVVGTFGYVAPEYIMYGKVDEKTDVYSYGVLLLELITGKEALQTNQESNHESLVLWARSLLSHGLYERLIDPDLNEDYNKEEMQRMMIAARLCLMHSSSRRPTMKMILKLLEEKEYWQNIQREREHY